MQSLPNNCAQYADRFDNTNNFEIIALKFSSHQDGKRLGALNSLYEAFFYSTIHREREFGKNSLHNARFCQIDSRAMRILVARRRGKNPTIIFKYISGKFIFLGV